MNIRKLLPSPVFIHALVVILACAIILCLIGLTERSHPDEYHIPFHNALSQPDDITCGPTSAAMLLNHYHIQVTIRQVEQQTKTKWITWKGQDIGTTSPDCLPVALNHFGLPAQLKLGNPQTLKHYLSQNKPCIVLLRSGETLWHYTLVIGYSKSYFTLADPADGSIYNMSVQTFTGCWSWRTDMEGKKCAPFLSDLLQKIDVYPYTFICPDRAAPGSD